MTKNIGLDRVRLNPVLEQGNRPGRFSRGQEAMPGDAQGVLKTSWTSFTIFSPKLSFLHLNFNFEVQNIFLQRPDSRNLMV